MTRNSCDNPGIFKQTRVIKPTRRSISGVYPFRSEVPIPYESTLERDFLRRTEWFECVSDIVPQPVEIPFTMPNGRSYIYTPDFLVRYKLGDHSPLDPIKPLLIEVKPAEAWRENWRDWLPKWKAAHRLCRENGWIFHIYDESRIRDKVLENLELLARYKKMEFASEDTEAVLKTVEESGCLPVHYVLARHFMGDFRGIGISHLWHLIASKKLECDLGRPLNDFTEVWIPYAD